MSWEIVYHAFIPDFAEKYSAHVIENLQKKGVSAERLAAEQAKMDQFKKLYANPIYNVGMTFMEVFPVGLIVTLVSAGILRKKGTPRADSAAGAVAG